MIDSTKPIVHGKKALELTMRDVLEGVEEAALYVGFEGKPNVMEILSIEVPRKTRPTGTKRSTVAAINSRGRPIDVSDYLIQRESTKKSA